MPEQKPVSREDIHAPIDMVQGPVTLKGYFYEGCATSYVFDGVEYIIVAPELADLQTLFRTRIRAVKEINPNLCQCVVVGSADLCSK